MMQTTRNWRVLVGGVTVGVVAAVGFAGAPASADPVFPPRPAPAQPTVTQPVIAPGAVADSAAGPGPAVVPAPAASPPAPGSAPVAPRPVPAVSGTLRDYLQGHGVQLEAQKPPRFDALDITVPMPPGWTPVPDPNVVDPFVVIANRTSNSLYTPNAQVVVYKLIGQFDPREAITHGFVDSRQLPGWRTTGASLADFGGFPSSIIDGTYRQNELILNTSRRHVIASSGPDTYLVSLAVTTSAGQAVALAPATDGIVNGFRVTAPGSTAGPAPAGPAAPPPQPLSAPSPAATVPGR